MAHADVKSAYLTNLQKKSAVVQGQIVKKDSRTSLRVSTVTAAKAPVVTGSGELSFDGIPIVASTKARGEKIVALFKRLKKQDPQGWAYVKANVKRTGDYTINMVETSYLGKDTVAAARAWTAAGRFLWNPAYLDAIADVATAGNWTISVPVHEAAHIYYYNNPSEGDFKDETFVDSFRAQSEARMNTKK